MMKSMITRGGAVLALAAVVACGDDNNNNNNNNNNNTPTVEMVAGELSADTAWTANKTYVLTGLVFVKAPATLTIEAGTTIQGDNGSALIVTRGAKIAASGTREKPIVFTSSAKVGERRSGDWGGVVLLGGAPINITGGENRIEGIEASDNRGLYGGTSATHDCGALRYVRIEFAGFELSLDNELNGLTLGGCGSATKLEYVQVHKGKDDGVEMFGGNADMKWVVVSQAEDDSVDWDQGYTGRVQFLMIQQNPADADAAFEADNSRDNNDAMPRSKPTIYNATIIGTNAGAGTQLGLVLRRGTWGIMRNLIIMGFPVAGVDVRDAAGVTGMMMSPPELTLENSIFFQNGMGGTGHFHADTMDDDGGFDEGAFLADAARQNRMSTDPLLPAAYDLTAPKLVPAAGSPAATGGATPPGGFFDAAATYVGAFAPGGADWTAGWTSFPQN